MCNFEVTTDDDSGYFVWARYSAKGLIDAQLPGPATDYNDNKDHYFMIASEKLAGNDSKPTAVTQLKSPFFKGKEHPIECLSFWYFFGVSFKAKTI